MRNTLYSDEEFRPRVIHDTSVQDEVAEPLDSSSRHQLASDHQVSTSSAFISNKPNPEMQPELTSGEVAAEPKMRASRPTQQYYQPRHVRSLFQKKKINNKPANFSKV